MSAIQSVQDLRLPVSFEFEWIPLGELLIDFYDGELEDMLPDENRLAYQRNQKKIEKSIVARGVDGSLFGVIVVNRRDNGDIVVVDGGTRCRALVKLDTPSEVLIPCLVNQWPPHEEVRRYLDWNTERLGLNQVDRFIARVSANEPVATHIEEILRDETGKGIRPGEWQCVEAISSAYSREPDGALLRRTLHFMRRMGWVDKPRGKTQHMMYTTFRMMMLPGFDEKVAEEKWFGLTPSAILTGAANENAPVMQSRTVYKGAMLFLARRYNTGLRGKKRLNVTELVGAEA